MNFIVDLIGWGLHFLEEGIEQGEEGVNGWEARYSGVSGKVDHSLLNIFVGDVFGCCLIIMFLVDLVKLLAYL
jgi:hypothetical protein